MLLELKNINKELPLRENAFGGKKFVKVLDDISLKVEKGRSLGIVGESGCGKTTLALISAGLLSPSQGEVVVEGKDIFKYGKELSRKRQIVFQDALASLNNRMTVRQIVEEPVLLNDRNSNRRKARIASMLEKVGLSTAESDRFPTQLSGGQQQRVAIARAMVCQPDLVILDEPVSSLDLCVQGQILNLLMDLQENFDLTYFFIAHDLNLIKQICTDVAVLYLGKVLEISPAEELFSHPWHPYSRALVSAVPAPDPRIQRKKDVFFLEGEVPSMLNRPDGCVFSTRCPEAEEICFQEQPELKKIDKNRLAACHFRNPRSIRDS